MGIEIMRYRAAAIGAELDLEDAPGGGTAVVCSLPTGAVGNGSGKAR
jgi:signal transduction histidine kinase